MKNMVKIAIYIALAFLAMAMSVNAIGKPSESKNMLGLKLKAIPEWEPTWDSDAKVAGWEHDDYFSGVVIRIVKERLNNVNDLKKAAPMMMQLGSKITKVHKTKKTKKGWYAVVSRDKNKSFLYIRKVKGVQIVCSASLTQKGMTSGKPISPKTAFKLCHSI